MDNAAPVTVARVDDVRGQIARALNLVAAGTLPEADGDAALEQACASACGLLRDVLAQRSPLAPDDGGDPALAALIRDPAAGPGVRDLLDGAFAAALGRAGGSGDLVAQARAEVDGVLRAAASAARRQPRLRRRQIAAAGWTAIGKLRDETCAAAAELRDDRAAGERRARRRQRALTVLRTASGFLLSLSVSLVLTAGGPRVVAQDAAVWAHAGVILVHDLAARAQPGVTVAPPGPGAGPR